MLREQLGVIDLPPGIVKGATRYATRNRFYDGNLVRWVAGQLHPIGGWQRITTSTLTGKARDMLAWADNSGDRWLAIGTSSKLYVTQGDATVFDITPAAFTAGSDDATEQTGYGGGNYGAELYGTPRSGGSYIAPAMWSLDLWGQYLVACARDDGRIFEWQLNTGADALVISGAPVNNVGILVSDQRHLIALGAGGDLRRVEWCDKEDNTDWTPSATNEAGGFDLQTQSPIKAGVRVRGTNLILTENDAHAMTYVGQPFVYNRERVGTDCGLIAPGALISVESQAFWMGSGAFWVFDGAMARELPCDVKHYVFSDIGSTQIEKAVAGHNALFGEVWWFYPQGGSTENNRYVLYNYREGWWSIGELARTCWDSGAVLGYPHAMGTDNHLYRHEDDWTNNGAARFQDIFITTGVLELGTGSRVGNVSQIIPDEDTSGELSVTFTGRYTPNGDEYTFGPYTVRDDGYTDVRFSARQVSMTLQPVADGDWTVGRWRLDVSAAGKR